MSNVRVLGFGDNIVDRFVDRGVEYPGGNAVNVAVFARRLGAEAGYLGVFGDDERGAFVRGAIEECGVDTSLSAVRPGPNGVTEIETVDGERRFLGWNQGGVTLSDPMRLGEEELRYAAGFSLIHSSAYSASVEELPKLAPTRALRSYDFSSEPEFRTSEYLDAVGPWIDLALVSCGDLSRSEVWAELRRVAGHGPRLVLGTRGQAGAMLFDGEAYYYSEAAPVPGPFLDTMGCGDAYLAAFVVELLRSGWRRNARPGGVALHRSMRQAAQFAALQCTVDGAFGHGRPIEGAVEVGSPIGGVAAGDAG
ncbi:PfkB family carbohydrate kinase [Leifsonia sp. F6_8S_P_1B]|uniref:PfkB family carbohydrate kinase n=1 Tax=Leifsonia williamsii TaxID=3035919 RepID=A0ABT8K9D3_9MICO|nr:PfkB family carbohydrate kinase [Leifsonia williamsii]MDN4614058.1 PfkB family carbohydrate kinase [Leifsonia williamsii]